MKPYSPVICTWILLFLSQILYFISSTIY
jgi:hypothetical protein